MPTDNWPPVEETKWPIATCGVLDGNGRRSYRYRQGFKRLKTDRRGLQLAYTGYNFQGTVLRAANPPIYSYVPTGFDGACPYINDWLPAPFSFREAAFARNKSWDKLMERVKGESSSLGVAAAEGRETFEMVAKRVMGLRRAFQSLRKGDFRQFLRELSVDPKRKHRSTIRTASQEAAGLWLEYWFGWSPTVQDIGAAAMTYSVQPILAASREHGTGMATLPQRSNAVGSGGSYRRRITASGRIFVKQGATFKVTNRNLYLANRLGLVNPAAIAWELVPFSFVVDWFTKFGSYLEGMTDLVGLEVSDPYSSSFMKLDQLYETGEFGSSSTPSNLCRISYRNQFQRRITSLSRPVPVSPKLSNFGNSVTRAATAVSLLTAIFLDGSLIRNDRWYVR